MTEADDQRDAKGETDAKGDVEANVERGRHVAHVLPPVDILDNGDVAQLSMSQRTVLAYQRIGRIRITIACAGIAVSLSIISTAYTRIVTVTAAVLA